MTAPTVNKRVPTKRHTNPPSLRLSLVRPLVPQVEKVRPGLKGIVGFVAGGGVGNNRVKGGYTAPDNGRHAVRMFVARLNLSARCLLASSQPIDVHFSRLGRVDDVRVVPVS